MPRTARERWTEPSSLGAKLVLILTAVGLAGSLGITLLLALVITPSFTRLEAQAVRAEVDRARTVLNEQAALVEGAARDGGGGAPRWLGPAGDEQRAALAAFADGLPVGGRRSVHFHARLGGRLAAVGVAETPRGRSVVARAVTSADLSALLGRRATLEPVPDGDPIASERDATLVSLPLQGQDGRPVAAVRLRLPRDVSVLGRRMLLLAAAGSTLLLLIVLMVTRRVVARLVLRPLARVEEHMQRVRASGSLSALAVDRRADEIGSLGRSFNAMLAQLKDLREQIEVQSFALGRSESAVAVMHNVRNALNPISTILSQGVAQAPSVDRATVDRALAELAADDVPPARRRKLAAFVAASVEAEARGREAMRGELQVGREAMAHVLEIIGRQQQQAHERPVLERVDVSEIVARNATIARYSQLASIAFTFPATPHHAMASRVILSQVIGNLLGNAAEAIAATGREGGSIAVTVAERHGRVEIRIRDDGEGFAGDGAPFFQRGFSTRAHKSGGLGLHWCANSMTAMEGSLRLESEGPGRGATAVLALCAAESEALAA